MVRPPTNLETKPVMTPSEAAAALGRHWGMVGAMDELASERDRVFLVRDASARPEAVLKVANLAENRDFLDCQHAVMQRLALAGVPVQPLCRSLDGEIVVGLGEPGPPWARLLGWIPGRLLADVLDPAPEIWADLGRTMGRTAGALLDFDHPAARRDFQWDVQQAEAVIAHGLDAVANEGRARLLAATLARLRADLLPRLPALRRSTIHNDANDHNVLVDDGGTRIVGLLDFGDLVYSVTAHEAAVAAAYAMLAALDPGGPLRSVVRGFDSTCALTADELDAMPSLILARAAASVAISAVQSRLDPDPYLIVSEGPAWGLLGWFMAQPPSALRAVVHEAVDR